MELNKFIDKFKKQSENFGFCFESQSKKIKNAVWRQNIHPEKEEEFKKGAYFGIINANEEPTGAYSDFSLVIFPNIECSYFVIALAVGSLGFNNDYTIATSPWMRRLFSRLRDNKYREKQFFKVDFSDIESLSAIRNHLEEIEDLQEVIKKYSKFLSACQIVDIKNHSEQKALKIVRQWLAIYAKFREVGGNNAQRNNIKKNLPKIKELDDYSEKLSMSIYTENDLLFFKVLLELEKLGQLTKLLNSILMILLEKHSLNNFMQKLHIQILFMELNQKQKKKNYCTKNIMESL